VHFKTQSFSLEPQSLSNLTRAEMQVPTARSDGTSHRVDKSNRDAENVEPESSARGFGGLHEAKGECDVGGFTRHQLKR
jgi:hypothetical protein